jgi:hypothetical protein
MDWFKFSQAVSACFSCTHQRPYGLVCYFDMVYVSCVTRQTDYIQVHVDAWCQTKHWSGATWSATFATPQSLFALSSWPLLPGGSSSLCSSWPLGACERGCQTHVLNRISGRSAPMVSAKSAWRSIISWPLRRREMLILWPQKARILLSTGQHARQAWPWQWEHDNALVHTLRLHGRIVHVECCCWRNPCVVDLLHLLNDLSRPQLQSCDNCWNVWLRLCSLF